MNGIARWLRLAILPEIVRRAARTAVIVGSILTAINHGGEIVSGTLTRHRLLQICLTIMVPYIVSTTSSVATLRKMIPPGESVESSAVSSAPQDWTWAIDDAQRALTERKGSRIR